MSEPQVHRTYLFYRFVCFSVRIGLKIWERFEVHGSENVPASGGCVVACNHVSYLDPPSIACSVRHRVIRFLARDTLSRTWIGDYFFRHIHAVSIDRTKGDVGALRKSIQVLKGGEVLGLFPEGTRSVDGELKPAKAGVGFLIAKAGVPVVPAYVDGSFQAYPKGAQRIKRGRVRVFFGPAIQPSEFAAFASERDGYEKISSLVMSRIAALKPAKSSAP